MTGINDNTAYALPLDRVGQLVKEYGGKTE